MEKITTQLPLDGSMERAIRSMARYAHDRDITPEAFLTIFHAGLSATLNLAPHLIGNPPAIYADSTEAERMHR